jgi:hypothetical protein
LERTLSRKRQLGEDNIVDAILTILTILPSVVLLVCLPIVALTIMGRRNERRQKAAAAWAIREQACPHCGGKLAAMEESDLQIVLHRFKVGAGMRIIWDRVSAYRVTCPRCATPICFDRSYRVTDCSGRDYWVRRGA